MKASPWAGAWASEAGNGAHRGRPWLALACIAIAFPVGAQEQTQAGAQEQTAAVLKLQEVDYFYRSSLAPLSCSEIQGRTASVLRALGARDDVEVKVDGCDAVVGMMGEPDATFRTGSESDRGWRGSVSADPWSTSSSRYGDRRTRREQTAHVRIRAMMPVQVTPEVLDEIKKDKSRRDLISRVTGNPMASMDEPIIFPAERRPVTLSRRTIDLEPQDCELLEQMSRDIFKDLGLRVVRRSTSCGRNEVSRIPPQLIVEALMPVMPSTPQLSPAPGGRDPDPGAPAGSNTEHSESTPPQQ